MGTLLKHSLQTLESWDSRHEGNIGLLIATHRSLTGGAGGLGQYESRLEIEEQWDGKGSPPRQ